MKLKQFQKQDLARLALAEGAILAWEPGLGKTLAALTWGLLKAGWQPAPDGGAQPLQPILIVAPGDLHRQFAAEAARFHRATLTPLATQEAYLALVQKGGGKLPPGFYITSYTQLGSNGRQEWPDPSKIELGDLLKIVDATPADAEADYAGRHDRNPESFPTWDQLVPLAREDFMREWAAERLNQFKASEGRYGWEMDAPACPDPSRKPNPEIRCVFSPVLADLCGDAFAAVIVDEGTRLKGGRATEIATGVLALKPRHRLVLTATPIKNRLPDLFHLAAWAAGGARSATARWPYALHDQHRFAATFCVSESHVPGRRHRAPRKKYIRLTPQVCNVHKAWKMIAPLILRRRKKDIGREIVPKLRQVLRVPMGRAQAAVYRSHLEWRPLDKNGKPALGSQLQALRLAAACPDSPLLPVRRGPAFIPKMAAALKLIQQILARGEQVILFSPFHDPLDTLERLLNEAGVRHLKMDGRTTPARRGERAGLFQLGPPRSGQSQGPARIPVLLAGVDCMAEGHSFPLCRNAIQYSYPWALDKVIQSEDRIHRLDSEKPVQTWRLICEGSVDRKMESQIDEKSDASEMILDGHLLGENPAEMNLAELLDCAAKEFDPESQTIDESILLEEWPSLKAGLAAAMATWDTPPSRPLTWRERYAARASLVH